jgi:hypothetical protein
MCIFVILCVEETYYFIYVKTHMTFVGFFWLPFCLKHISYFHNILWLGTDAATSFLPINQQYMYAHMLRFNIVRCVFLLFYVLKKHIILYAWWAVVTE